MSKYPYGTSPQNTEAEFSIGVPHPNPNRQESVMFSMRHLFDHGLPGITYDLELRTPQERLSIGTGNIRAKITDGEPDYRGYTSEWSTEEFVTANANLQMKYDELELISLDININRLRKVRNTSLGNGIISVGTLLVNYGESKLTGTNTMSDSDKTISAITVATSLASFVTAKISAGSKEEDQNRREYLRNKRLKVDSYLKKIGAHGLHRFGATKIAPTESESI